MNKWLVVLLLLFFFSLTFISVLFGNRIKKIETLDPAHLRATLTPSKTETSSSSAQDSSVNSPQEIQRIFVVAENLEIPWGLAFLPDGRMLFTERPGRVRIIDANGLLQQKPVAILSEVFHIGEGGLLGIAAHPQFATNNYVYVYYTYANDGDDTLNRVVRYKFQNNALTDKKIIVDAIPGNSNHNGGRIKFGQDGYLYITTGDAQEPSLSQNKSSLAGKILRIMEEKNDKVEVYSYGHRNPQGLAWDDKGRLWATEHGPSAFDELNLIESGKNYGWPTITGSQTRTGMMTPILNSGSSTTWAPSGMAYFSGSLFFGGLRGQGLFEAVIDGEKAGLKKHFGGEYGRIRDVILGPNNVLYITTSNRDGRASPKKNDDKILRVNPVKL